MLPTLARDCDDAMSPALDLLIEENPPTSRSSASSGGSGEDGSGAAAVRASMPTAMSVAPISQ